MDQAQRERALVRDALWHCQAGVQGLHAEPEGAGLGLAVCRAPSGPGHTLLCCVSCHCPLESRPLNPPLQLNCLQPFNGFSTLSAHPLSTLGWKKSGTVSLQSPSPTLGFLEETSWASQVSSPRSPRYRVVGFGCGPHQELTLSP